MDITTETKRKVIELLDKHNLVAEDEVYKFTEDGRTKVDSLSNLEGKEFIKFINSEIIRRKREINSK